MSDVTLQDIQDFVGSFHLDESLQFFSHLLAVSRGEKEDMQLSNIIYTRNAGCPAFAVHFLVKQLLLNSSNMLPRHLTGEDYCHLQDMLFQLRDPIQDDTEWENANPTGALSRMFAQQFPAQRRNHLLRIGIAHALFGDCGIVSTPVAMKIRNQLERLLEMPFEHFTRMGFLCGALRRDASRRFFTHHDLIEAFHQGFQFCVPEKWEPFLKRTSITRDDFRRRCKDVRETIGTPYAQFEFNPLTKFPIIEGSGRRFVVTDPDLLIDRTTTGVYFDLLDQFGEDFTRDFGCVFESLVGEMLRSVFQKGAVWSESDWKDRYGDGHERMGKRADWALFEADRHILFECKGLRMPVPLTTYGDDNAVDALRGKIAKAARQLAVHASNILNGKWISEGFATKPSVGVIVTFGHVEAANLPFFRRPIAETLHGEGVLPIPYVVLSIEELDTLMSLVEEGQRIDEIMTLITSTDGSCDVLRGIRSRGGNPGVSRLLRQASSHILDFLGPTTSREC
jgi:hypothetical protein